MLRYAFVTVTDHWFFPGTLATVNSILAFHPDAEIFVVINNQHPLTPAQLACFEQCGHVRLMDSDQFRATGRLMNVFELKAYASSDLSVNYDVIVGIDSDCLLCSPVDDVIRDCQQRGGFFGGQDGGGVEYDGSYRPYGMATPAFNPRYMSTSLYFCAANDRNRYILKRWDECCNQAEFNGTGACPGYLDQGVLNAVLFAENRTEDVHLLENHLWSQHGVYWESIIDFRDGQFINRTAGDLRQRSFHCGGTEKFWSREHSRRVVDCNALQTYPYVWFLAMLWFGECQNWEADPFWYLPIESHHLMDDLVHFFPQIVHVFPRARELWDRLSEVMIDRILEGIPRTLALGGGAMSELIGLVSSRPDIRRYVEIGSYEGGSILALALRFLNRDCDFYAVESFMGNMDGTVDGFPLPSRQEFLNNLSRFANVRARLMPGDSRYVASQFQSASLDFVFIDACHETASVLRDIDEWTRKLKPGGILAGDDYSWPTVRDAVHERVPRPNVTPSGSIWWVEVGSESRGAP